MFFILSKVLHFLIYPLPLLFLSLLGILLFYNRKHARRTLLIVLVVFYILSIPLTSSYLLRWLEVPRPAPGELKQHYDVVIVLAGMVNLGLSKGGQIEFNNSVDRILAGISLVKRGLGDKLLISGGSGDLFDQSSSEAELLKDFAIESGLSADQILVEGTSRNTYENAVNSAKLIRSRNYQNILLVTSAFHIPRAAAVFHKQGIFPDFYPVDYHTGRRITPFSFVPSVGSLEGLELVIHELIGMVAYRIQGYI